MSLHYLYTMLIHYTEESPTSSLTKKSFGYIDIFRQPWYDKLRHFITNLLDAET